MTTQPFPTCFVIETETFLFIFTLYRSKIWLDLQQKEKQEYYFSQWTTP